MSYTDTLKQRAKKNLQKKALLQLSPYQIILAPMMTEKTYKLQEKGAKYTFKIHPMSNKNDIKHAVKTIFKVDPLHINIMNVVEKGRSQRKLVRRAYKKAIVTIPEGQKLDLVG